MAPFAPCTWTGRKFEHTTPTHGAWVFLLTKHSTYEQKHTEKLEHINIWNSVTISLSLLQLHPYKISMCMMQFNGLIGRGSPVKIDVYSIQIQRNAFRYPISEICTLYQKKRKKTFVYKWIFFLYIAIMIKKYMLYPVFYITEKHCIHQESMQLSFFALWTQLCQ